LVRKIRSLSWLEWRIVLSSLVMLPYCAACLRLQGFRRTQSHFLGAHVSASTLTEQEQLDLARRAARATSIAARFGLFRANCLCRSLVLGRWLHRRGIESQLKLGVDLAEGDLSAHAWVEHCGVVVNDHRHIGKRFTAFVPTSDDCEDQTV